MSEAPERIYTHQWIDEQGVPHIAVVFNRDTRTESDEPLVEYIRADTQPQLPTVDWSSAPEWAQWASPRYFVHGAEYVALVFTWMFYENKPRHLEGYMYANAGGRWEATQSGFVPHGIDYRLIGLQRRPEATP